MTWGDHTRYIYIYFINHVRLAVTYKILYISRNANQRIFVEKDK